MCPLRPANPPHRQVRLSGIPYIVDPEGKNNAGMQGVRSKVTGLLTGWQGRPHPSAQNEISFPNGPSAQEFPAGGNSLSSSAEPCREHGLRTAR